MRNTHVRHHRSASKRVPTASIKRMYRHSLKNIKSHPIPSIGVLTLGAGLLSGMYVFLRSRRW